MYSVFGSFWYNVIDKRKDVYANQLLTVNCIFFQEEERRKITLLESKVDELQLRLTEANQKLVCILFFMIHYTDASVEGFFLVGNLYYPFPVYIQHGKAWKGQFWFVLISTVCLLESFNHLQISPYTRLFSKGLCHNNGVLNVITFM